jgi:hypothetical protein
MLRMIKSRWKHKGNFAEITMQRLCRGTDMNAGGRNLIQSMIMKAKRGAYRGEKTHICVEESKISMSATDIEAEMAASQENNKK